MPYSTSGRRGSIFSSGILATRAAHPRTSAVIFASAE